MNAPHRWTAPAGGLYHFGTGGPHLAQECGGRCPGPLAIGTAASVELVCTTPGRVDAGELDSGEFVAAWTDMTRSLNESLARLAVAIRVSVEPTMRAFADIARYLQALNRPAADPFSRPEPLCINGHEYRRRRRARVRRRR